MHHKSLNSFSIYKSFETLNNTKITTQIGGTAILPCTVDASSLATVTWIRRNDYSLLTGSVHEFTFSLNFLEFHILKSFLSKTLS